MSDNLFWYPERAMKSDGDYDKERMLRHDINYWLNRLQSMFKYENLPDTIPAKWFENYLLCNGNCIIAKDDKDRLIAYVGNNGTKRNVYYVPCGYIVANPYFNKGLIAEDDNSSSGFSKEFTIGIDCQIIYNDVYAEGVLPLLHRFCSRLIENEITMDITDILTRAMLMISASDDKTKKSADLFLKRLREGHLSTIETQAFIDGLNIQGFERMAQSLTNLIEYHQYLKAGLFNELGLNSNYNMKRESINSNESQLNDDMLHPLIDTMLREREEGIARVNAMFNTDIKVSFNSSWLENEMEEDAIHQIMQAEKLQAEEAVILPLIDKEIAGNDNSVDTDTVDNSIRTEDVVTEEVTEEVTEDVSDITTNDIDSTDDNTVDNGTGQLTEEDIEDTTEVLETIEEVIEEVTEEETEEEEVKEDGTEND
mgnify:CR=1 FL=1